MVGEDIEDMRKIKVESLKTLIFADMNKPQAKGRLIPVRDFATTYIGWRGHSVSVQYIYKLIDKHRKEGKPISFKYKEIGKQIWIEV